MIVIERELTADEAESVSGKQVLDLNHQTAGAQNRTKLFRWLDEAEAHPIRFSNAGKSVSISDFMALDGHSYWLHVRARIFYQLFRQAQLLDRLPENTDFRTIQTVYAHPENHDFWTRWAPQAVCIIPSFPAKSSTQPSRREALRWLYDAFKRSFRTLPTSSTPVIFFSNVFYNRAGADGFREDRQFETLFAARPEGTLRLELMPVPPKSMTADDLLVADAPPFRYANVRLDAVLVRFLLRHPHHIVQAIWHLKTLRKRFAAPFYHEGLGDTPDSVWASLFRTHLQKTRGSVIICHLSRLAATNWLRTIRPRVVAGSSENNSIGRTIIEAARSLDIPTLGLQHGNIDPHNADYRFSATLMPQAAPDVFGVWGEETRNWLIENSHYHPARTIAVGRMVADQAGQADADANLIQFKQKQKRPLLLFASQAQGLFDEYRTLAASEVAAFCRAEGYCCVVKPHPRETDDGLYRKTFTEAGISERLLEVQGDLYAMISAADLGGTCYSTVAWEMMWAGLPCVIFDPLQLDLLRVQKLPFVYSFKRTEIPFSDWKQALETHRADAKTAAEAKLGPADGQCSARVWALLDELAASPDFIG